MTRSQFIRSMAALFSLALATSATGALGQEKKALAYTGLTVHTGTGEVLEDATIVVEDDTIKQIGKGLRPPTGAIVVEVKDRIATPGLVDALTSIGLVEVGLEPSTHDDYQSGAPALIRAGFRAVDGFNPGSTLIDIARAGGLTSVGVIPHGGLIAGQSAWADLDGSLAPGAIAQGKLALHVNLDAGAGGPGMDHATAILRVREAFDDARAYSKSRAAWERNQSRPFAPSRLDLDALAGALDQKLPVVFHVSRAAGIRAALEVAKEFKLRPVIAGGAEAWKVADKLAKAKVPVIVFPLEQPDSFDSLGAREDNAALLHKAGVEVALSTGESHNARKLRQVAGNAVRAGLPHEVAISAITRAPAEALGMGARYGTLAPGKLANFVLWSGDPLELGTDVRGVVIHGRPMSLANRQSALLAKYRKLPR